MSVLIVVFTPMQFLNAVVYIENKKQECELVVLTTNKTNIDQIKRIDTKSVCKFPLSSVENLSDEILWFVKLLYIKWFIKSKNFENVVIGNFNNVAGYYLALKFSKLKKEVILLDDGLATVKIYLDRNKKNILYNNRLFGGRFINLYKLLFALNKKNEISSLGFFTSYDLERKQNSVYDKVFLQKCERHKNSNKIIQENLVWFIGAPVVEYNILSREKYDLIIIALIKSLESIGKKVFYILHRFEDEKLEGLRYKRFDKPLEVVFEEMKTLPELIISFYSSALINLASVYDIVNCQYIDITKFGVDREDIKNVYSLMKTHENLIELKMDNNGK